MQIEEENLIRNEIRQLRVVGPTKFLVALKRWTSLSLSVARFKSIAEVFFKDSTREMTDLNGQIVTEIHKSLCHFETILQ